MTYPSNWQVLGYVLLHFRNSDIISMYLNNTEPYRSVFVTDSHGEIISLVDNLKTKNYVQESYVQLLLSSEPFVVGNYLAYTVKLNNLWYVVSMTEIDAVARTELTSSLAFYIFALLVCAVITLCVSYLLSKHFMRPIKILTDRMHEVEEGDLHSRANIQTHDEFEDLANSYNKMIQRIEVLMRQIIFEQEQKRKADIHLLQVQINPHFLYNTLASIRYMVHTSPPAETDKILLALGRFLKYVLSNREDVYVTIDHELEQLDNYITIQGVGFDADLQYRVTVEKGLGHYMVVKMLLQPLVENALLHGLKLNKKDPLLHIDIASASNDMLQIKIIDNGTGFDVTSLSQKPSDDLPHHHLGISNVQQRLLLHYGESFKFDIQSTKGVGTTISIQIPKLTAEEIDNESVNR